MNASFPEDSAAGVPGRPFFSVIIPVYNEAGTIKGCLSSIFASTFRDFEVIIVDDCSTDGSGEAARRFPVRFFRQPRNLGPSRARNRGAELSRGRFLVFSDADCVFPLHILEETARLLRERGLRLLGGTYQSRSAEGTFVADFHALRAVYYETRKSAADYLASHYLVVERGLFGEIGGFRCDEWVGRVAACEDLELSRRLIKAGMTLRVFPELAVKHLFGFGVRRSLRNAFRKSLLWVRYLRAEKRLAADTGVGSTGLKLNVVLVVVFLAGIVLSIWNRLGLLLPAAALAAMAAVNRGLLHFIFRRRGLIFTLGAFFYYCIPFAFSVGLGGAAGFIEPVAGPGEDGLDPVS